MLLGLCFIEAGLSAAAVKLVVGTLKHPPPGCGWTVRAGGRGMILLAFPPFAGDILLELERTFDWPVFDAGRAVSVGSYDAEGRSASSAHKPVIKAARDPNAG